MRERIHIQLLRNKFPYESLDELLDDMGQGKEDKENITEGEEDTNKTK